MADLSPAELWKVLQEQADEDTWLEQQTREVAAMSDAALDDELRRAGYDLDDVTKQASALYLKIAPAEAPSAVVPPAAPRVERAGRRRPVAAWVAAAASAAAVTGGLVYTALQEGLPAHGRPDAAPSAPPSIAAADLRARAAAALDQGRPDECVRLLDDARKLDPEGDTAPDVVRLRERARGDGAPR